MPKFALQTFKSWLRQPAVLREIGREGDPVGADTFHNYFHPEVVAAAVRYWKAPAFRCSCLQRPSVAGGRYRLRYVGHGEKALAADAFDSA
jgi:hypothetical protein